MKLTIECIREEALDIYRKAVSDHRIDEDMCAELYETFTKRMTRYREKYPDRKEVTPAFVATAVRYIIRDIRKKRRQEEYRDENVRILEQGTCCNEECASGENNLDPREEKLHLFLRGVIACKHNVAIYAYYFVLYYSYYLSEGLIERIAMLAGVSPETVPQTVRSVRSKAIECSLLRMEKADADASRVYNRIISCHRRMSDTFDEHERVRLVGKCRELKTLQENVLAARRKIRTVPTLRDLAEIVGYNEITLRYGLKMFHNILGGDPLPREFDRAA